MSIKNYKEVFGAELPKYDIRDYKITDKSFTENTALVDQKEFTLESISMLPLVKNQGAVGSCVAHATSEIVEYFYQLEEKKYCRSSTNFIYGMQRTVSGRNDGGMYLRDACKIIKDYGNVKNTDLPGNNEMPIAADIVDEFKKDKENLKNLPLFKVSAYARCAGTRAIKLALVSGSPVLASMYFSNGRVIDKTGKMEFDEKNKQGLHGIMIYGWNEYGWLVQNSWGTTFGNLGRCIVPYSHLILEAWSFIDAVNGFKDFKKPNVPAIISTVINAIVNFFLRIFKRK